jgi:predicted TIM-barrel fold metal-dependent hydrolase
LTKRRYSAAEIRSGLGHPVVDADGHWQETVAVFLDYLHDELGPGAEDALRRLTGDFYATWYDASDQERLQRRVPRAPWWPEPSNTRDRATATLPGLLYDRLDELGIDLALVYPTLGLFGLVIADDEIRQPFARAANRMARDAFAPYANRLIPVAVVPHRSPDEAIEVLDDAIELGFRAMFTTGAVRRAAPTGTPYIDFLALDSPYDYDRLWRRCCELGVAVTVHGGSFGWPDRSSPSNSVFNHIGHFANASHGFCKAIVLGGVLRRFPSLCFALLEGGVGWACQLRADLVGHWEKRHLDTLLANLRPSNLDPLELRKLFGRYADARLKDRLDDYLGSTSPTRPFTSIEELTSSEPDLDEFAAAGIRDASDITEWFEDQLFFGCEADDPVNAWAFDARSGARLRAMLGSDISHFDVPDMAAVLPEAYELIERGLMSEDDFEQFVFGNVVDLHTAGNPSFFAGTVVEAEVSRRVRRIESSDSEPR